MNKLEFRSDLPEVIRCLLTIAPLLLVVIVIAGEIADYLIERMFHWVFRDGEDAS